MTVGRRLKRYLVTGFIVLAPLSISVFLLLWLVAWVDGLLLPLTHTLLSREIPGLGLATALLLALAVGWLASNIVGQQVLDLVEDFILHVPVLAWLYKTAKQLTDVFSPAGKAQFRSVVMVEYPRPGVFQLGFATGTLVKEEEGRSETLTAVYIPMNHIYVGDVLLVPSENLRQTSMTLQEGIQFFLSAGAASPASLKTEPPNRKDPG